MPTIKRFPNFTLLYLVPTHTQNNSYTVFIQTKSTINTHLKLTDKNKDHAYTEKLIPHSQCVVVYANWYFSVFKLTDNAFTPSMMDDRTANFRAAQYRVKYSNFTSEDKLLNLIGKMNNAVPLILNPFHLKGKMLCHNGHLN